MSELMRKYLALFMLCISFVVATGQAFHVAHHQDHAKENVDKNDLDKKHTANCDLCVQHFNQLEANHHDFQILITTTVNRFSQQEKPYQFHWETITIYHKNLRAPPFVI